MRAPLSFLLLFVALGVARADHEFEGTLSKREGTLYLGEHPLAENEHSARLDADLHVLSGRTITVSGELLKGELRVSWLVAPRYVAQEGYVLADHAEAGGLVFWVFEPEVYPIRGAFLPLLQRQLGRRVIVRGWNQPPAQLRNASRGGELEVTGIRTTDRADLEKNPSRNWATDPSSSDTFGVQAGTYTRVRGTLIWDAQRREMALESDGEITRLLVELERWPTPLLAHYEGLEFEFAGLLLPPRPGGLGSSTGETPRPTLVVERLLSPQRAVLTGKVQDGHLHVGERALTLVVDPEKTRDPFSSSPTARVDSQRLADLLAHAEGRVVELRGRVFLAADGTPHAVRPLLIRMVFPVSEREVWVSKYDPNADVVTAGETYRRGDLRFPDREPDPAAAEELSGLSARLRGAVQSR